MEIGQIEFIVAWVSIIGTTLGGVFAAFIFLHREMRRGFDLVDQKFEGVDEKIEGLRSDVTSLQVSVTRIEGHLGIGFPSADEPRESSERPDCAA